MDWLYMLVPLYITYYTLVFANHVRKKEDNIFAAVFIFFLAFSIMLLSLYTFLKRQLLFERNIKRYDRFENKYDNYGVFELSGGASFRHHQIEWIKKLTAPFNDIVLKEVIYTTMNGNESNGFYYIGSKINDKGCHS